MADAQHDETLFFAGMAFIEELPRVLIEENRLGLLEGHTMLREIRACLGRILLEVNHTYSVHTQ